MSVVHAITALDARLCLLGYLLIVNLTAFVLMGADKRRARRGRFRIPESVLFTWAAFGGRLGAILGMHIFRHTTRKPAFRFGLPAILAAQLLLVFLVWYTSSSVTFQ